jgi:hypothetical protein
MPAPSEGCLVGFEQIPEADLQLESVHRGSFECGGGSIFYPHSPLSSVTCIRSPCSSPGRSKLLARWLVYFQASFIFELWFSYSLLRFRHLNSL